MHLVFLTPLAALVALAAALPVGAIVAAHRREECVRRSLLLGAARARSRFVAGACAVLALTLVGVAAAQPVVQHGLPRKARTDAAVYVVFDISRSMTAAQAANEPDRLARAKAFALALRPRLASVPVGVASFTDRVLPLLFPTPDAGAFASVVREAVAVDEPAPQRFYAERATALDSLAQFRTQAYFERNERRRVLVVLTDGESQPVGSTLADALRSAPPVHVVLVHVAKPGDAIYTTSVPDPNYHADPRSRAFLDRAASLLHGKAFGASDVGSAAAAVRAALGNGPVSTVTEPSRLALMPYVTLLAFVPLAFVLWRRNVAL